MRFSARWALFAALLALSIVLTVVLWPNGAFLFLFLPFVLPWRSKPAARAPRTCPVCGWRTESSEDRFCPRDGAPLPS